MAPDSVNASDQLMSGVNMHWLSDSPPVGDRHTCMCMEYISMPAADYLLTASTIDVCICKLTSQGLRYTHTQYGSRQLTAVQLLLTYTT